LMNSTLVKFSARELLQAGQLAHEVMTQSLADQDTVTFDSTLVRSGISYWVTRQATLTDNLAGITVTVYRQKQDRKVIELYDAFVVR